MQKKKIKTGNASTPYRAVSEYAVKAPNKQKGGPRSTVISTGGDLRAAKGR